MHFRQPGPQQFKCISHQELSIRYVIPPVFVTAAFIADECLHRFTRTLTKQSRNDTDVCHYNPQHNNVLLKTHTHKKKTVIIVVIKTAIMSS